VVCSALLLAGLGWAGQQARHADVKKEFRFFDTKASVVR
jgi:hypothetical protein